MEAYFKVSSQKPVGRKLASIPLLVWRQWVEETKGEIQKDPAVLSRYLEENKEFRTNNSGT